MYELFLTTRYLTRKAIVIFPILVVWLCVAMLIIVTSIMGGFVDRVKTANRELMGDIIVESASRAGWPHYEELQRELARLVGKDGKPLIEISTPVVRAYGLFNVGRANAPVQVIGIDPAGRAAVSRFRESLHRQYAAPVRAVDDLSRGGFPVTGKQLRERAETLRSEARTQRDQLEMRDSLIERNMTIPGAGFNWAWLFLIVPMLLIEWLLIALTRDASRRWRLVWWIFPSAVTAALVVLAFLPTLPHRPGPRDRELLEDAYQQNAQFRNAAERARNLVELIAPDRTIASRQELADVLVPKVPRFEPYPPPSVLGEPGINLPGAIVGVDLGLYERDRRGNYDRPPIRDNTRGTLTVAPVLPGGGMASITNAQSQQVQVVDDSYSRVFDVDSTYVYVPFEVAQKLALMHAMELEDGTGKTPARISELQIKLRGNASERDLAAAAVRINEALREVIGRHETDFLNTGGVRVQTWDEKQKRYIEAVVNEKRMITFILGLMSVVVLVVIFLIFYIIVRDKTRDIGIIKAVGGSELGVANIFQLYGVLIGAVGGGLGVALGVAFVLHTNEIHEWIYQTFGVLIWNRSVYLFDRIPDQVNPMEVTIYFLTAVVAGWLGALIPATVAGFSNPIRALRHE